MNKITRSIMYLVILSIPMAGLVYTLPRDVHLQVSGVEYRLGDEESVNPINVQMTGSLQRRFFEHSRFRGNFIAGDHSLEDVDVVLNPDGSLVMVRNKETGKLERFGVIYADNNLDKWTMAVLEPFVQFGQTSEEKFWDIESGLMISTPADSREEALYISNELMGNLLEEPLQ